VAAGLHAASTNANTTNITNTLNQRFMSLLQRISELSHDCDASHDTRPVPLIEV
jgi:hypothetical protein